MKNKAMNNKYVGMQPICSPYDKERKTAYICSPYNADTFEKRCENMLLARVYMKYATENLGVNARAPHAYLPMVTYEEKPEERQLALEFGQKLLECCDVIYVCGNRMSRGMEGELQRAASLNMEIVVFDLNLYIEVKHLMVRIGSLNDRVRLLTEHKVMEQTELGGEWKEAFDVMHI